MFEVLKGNIKTILKGLFLVLGIMFTFLILDVGVRCFLWKDIGFVSYRSFSPLAFSVSYILIILTLILLFPKRFKIIYVVSAIIFNIYLLCQMIHFKVLDNFFSVISLFSIGEGADYFDYAIKSIDEKMLILIFLSLLSVVVVLFLEKKFLIFKKSNLTFKKKIILTIIMIGLFIGCRWSAVYKLGEPISTLAWDAWMNPRNVYDSFNNKNKSFIVSGLYEYPFRDVYLYVEKILNPDIKENVEYVNKYINNLDIELEKNEYTGMFEGKNLIMIMMESIDEALVNEEVMPTLTRLSKTGLNFNNRYAPFFGEGMTINSEFASISGLYSISYEKAIYNYNENNFKYSLPNLFKEVGYSVNSIHMNNGEFYNRRNFHISLGFENHYPLFQQGYEGNFMYDSVIVSEEDSYKLIKSTDKFMTFITTYSAHIPYTDNYMCEDLAKKDNSLVVKGDAELSCLRMLSRETDDFIKLLLERLDEDGVLDDTVIVLFSDHYSCGYSKISELRGMNDTNMIQKTPFVIWSNDMEGKTVDLMVDTTDIPVTLFNLFGISYDPKLYMGTDVFSSYHENFVYFSDYSWYDGKIYSKYSDETDYVKKISSKVAEKIDINGKIISSNFYNYYN